MKAWRRGYSHHSPSAAAVGPVILSIQSDGSESALVTFSAAVTMLTSGSGGLTLAGDVCDWVTQVSATEILVVTDGPTPVPVGSAWSFVGPDDNLDPQPNTPQSGITIA